MVFDGYLGRISRAATQSALSFLSLLQAAIMRSPFVVAVVTAVSLPLVSAKVDFHSLKNQAHDFSRAVPGAYIVELSQPVDGLGRRSGENAR